MLVSGVWTLDLILANSSCPLARHLSYLLGTRFNKVQSNCDSIEIEPPATLTGSRFNRLNWPVLPDSHDMWISTSSTNLTPYKIFKLTKFSLISNCCAHCQTSLFSNLLQTSKSAYNYKNIRILGKQWRLYFLLGSLGEHWEQKQVELLSFSFKWESPTLIDLIQTKIHFSLSYQAELGFDTTCWRVRSSTGSKLPNCHMSLYKDH